MYVNDSSDVVLCRYRLQQLNSTQIAHFPQPLHLPPITGVMVPTPVLMGNPVLSQADIDLVLFITHLLVCIIILLPVSVFQTDVAVDTRYFM